MATNELGHRVPANVEQAVNEQGCLGGVKYVYRDGDYGGKRPVASIRCQRPTRFRSSNYENFKVPIADGWVAFKSPTYSTKLADAGEERVSPKQVGETPDDTLDAILRLTDPDAYSAEQDSWLQQTKASVDQGINALIKEFMKLPYLHRVEHSLHVRLCVLLASLPNSGLGAHYPIGEGLGVTQLIHKEWPETFVRPTKRNRGNFDIVVMSPSLLAKCPEIQDFRQGRLAAPIVVEVGLDYDARHLAKDAHKLINSRPYQGYLVHLARSIARDPQVEQIVLNLEGRTGIRTGYALVQDRGAVYKLVTDDTLTETHNASGSGT